MDFTTKYLFSAYNSLQPDSDPTTTADTEHNFGAQLP